MPSVYKALAEMGGTLNVSDFLDQHFHYLITGCDNAKESCPIFPGNSIRLHWLFPDPPHEKTITEEVRNEFRKVRDLIHAKFKRVAEAGSF